MLELLTELFGEYTPITYEVVDAEGVAQTIIPAGLSGVNWQYVFLAAIFLVCLYSGLKTLGAVISRV